MPRPATQPIVLNGSHGEGGGALLRTALVMSAMSQQPLRVHAVRGATRKPGLNPEDLAFLRTLATSCVAKVDGDELGAMAVTFEPTRAPRALETDVDIHAFQSGKSPGNSLVLAQALLPVLARAGAYSRLRLFGETHNNNTLTFDAFERSTLAAHRAQGLYAFPTIISAGFGYAGRGETLLEIEPSALEPIHWPERRAIVSAGAVVTTVEQSSGFVSDALSGCLKHLQESGLGDQVDHIPLAGPEPGLSVTFFANFERGSGSSSSVMQRGGQAAATVKRAWEPFAEWLATDATTDPFLADQILPLAALAEGKTTYTTPLVTRRLLTMAWVVKQFFPIHLTIKGREGAPGTITIER